MQDGCITRVIDIGVFLGTFPDNRVRCFSAPVYLVSERSKKFKDC